MNRASTNLDVVEGSDSPFSMRQDADDLLKRPWPRRPFLSAMTVMKVSHLN